MVNASWSFVVPSPAMEPVHVTLEIDWDRDGMYAHSASNVTGDLVKKTLNAYRGRTLQSRRRAIAGRLTARLWNLDAKYDPINTGSPIFGKNIAGVGVRVLFDGAAVWSGVLDIP